MEELLMLFTTSLCTLMLNNFWVSKHIVTAVKESIPLFLNITHIGTLTCKRLERHTNARHNVDLMLICIYDTHQEICRNTISQHIYKNKVFN